MTALRPLAVGAASALQRLDYSADRDRAARPSVLSCASQLTLTAAQIKAVFVSPRQRAQRTLDLLLGSDVPSGRIRVDDMVREYEYGEYEGSSRPVAGPH